MINNQIRELLQIYVTHYSLPLQTVYLQSDIVGDFAHHTPCKRRQKKVKRIDQLSTRS